MFNKSSNEIDVREKLESARKAIDFLNSEESTVLEFWQIWQESLPPKSDLDGITVYEVSMTVRMEKLTWRVNGPQHVFIQKMVDFFWNVGAPESEIDRLNDVGASINPPFIGSWIDMSSRGGMDGGWFFPVEIYLSSALPAIDSGSPSAILEGWARKHMIDRCILVGRDMGAAPPRQTELRFHIPGSNFAVQYEVVLDAFNTFRFPTFPIPALELLMSCAPECGALGMSIVISTEGFIKMGLFISHPTNNLVSGCFRICESLKTESAFRNFEQSFGVTGPNFVEFFHLKEGYGYRVYREDFDIQFHYKIGEEGPN